MQPNLYSSGLRLRLLHFTFIHIFFFILYIFYMYSAWQVNQKFYKLLNLLLRAAHICVYIYTETESFSHRFHRDIKDTRKWVFLIRILDDEDVRHTVYWLYSRNALIQILSRKSNIIVWESKRHVLTHVYKQTVCYVLLSNLLFRVTFWKRFITDKNIEIILV